MANIDLRPCTTTTESAFKKYDLIEGTKIKKTKSALFIGGSTFAGGVAGIFAGFAVAALSLVVPYAVGAVVVGLIGAGIGGCIASLTVCLRNRSLKAQYLEKSENGESAYNKVKHDWEQIKSRIDNLNLDVANKTQEINNLQPDMIEERNQQQQLAELQYAQATEEYHNRFDTMITNLKAYWGNQIHATKYNKAWDNAFNNRGLLFSTVNYLGDSIAEVQSNNAIAVFAESKNNSYLARENLISQLMSNITRINPHGANNNLNLFSIKSALVAVLNQCTEPPVKIVKKGSVERRVDTLNAKISKIQNFDIESATLRKKTIEEQYNILNGEFPADLKSFTDSMPD